MLEKSLRHMERLKIVLKADNHTEFLSRVRERINESQYRQKIPLLGGSYEPRNLLIIVACGAVVVYLDCTLESPGKLRKLFMPGSHPRGSG